MDDPQGEPEGQAGCLPIVILALLVLVGSFAIQAIPEPVLPSVPDLAKSVPKPAPKTRLYLFTMPGCLPCARLKAALHDPSVQAALKRFDLKETQDASQQRKYEVGQFPTLVALGKSGVHKQVGYMNPAQTVAWLHSID